MNETRNVSSAQDENDLQNQINPSGEQNGYKPDTDRLGLFEELQAIAPMIEGKTRADLEGEGYSFLESFIFGNGENGHINAGEIKRILDLLKRYPAVNRTHKYAIVRSSDKDSGKHEQKYEVMIKAKDTSEIPKLSFEELAWKLNDSQRSNALARDRAPKV